MNLPLFRLKVNNDMAQLMSNGQREFDRRPPVVRAFVRWTLPDINGLSVPPLNFDGYNTDKVCNTSCHVTGTTYGDNEYKVLSLCMHVWLLSPIPLPSTNFAVVSEQYFLSVSYNLHFLAAFVVHASVTPP